MSPVHRILAVIGLLLAPLAPMPAMADDPNPSLSTLDHYASLSGNTTSKQGFQSSTTSNYLGGNNNFTVEAWLMPGETATSSVMSIFVKTDMFQYQINNGTYEFIFNSSGWKALLSTGVRARVNEWQHVAFVKSGNTLNFYLNGGLAYQLNDATNIPTSLTNLNTYTSIGSNPWNGSSNQASPFGNLFSGGIDEVKVWTVARSQSEIKDNMNVKIAPNTSGLASYWDFNGTSSSTSLHDRTTLLNMNIGGTPKPSFPDVKTSTISNGFQTVTFTRTYLNAAAGYEIPAGVSQVSALIVGGGGGGGFDGGGGGGGGGVYQNSTLSVTPGSSYQVLVGGGGSPANGYTGGSLICNGSWSGAALGCTAAAGGTSRFGNISASGGGGGGGIEASGGADSDASANVRGGGGGVGGQNSRAGLNSPGAGAFSGGTAASDTLNVGGGGGGSSSAAGSTGQMSAAGNGAAGTTASLNSTVYGGGGAGGSFYSSTVAQGGSGAADGGSSNVGPTIPAVNRGGGGGAGGNGNTPGNALGTNGAAGIVIIRFALGTTATISLANEPIFRTSNTITATTSTASKVTFFADGKRISGCISRSTVSLVATCNWSPSRHGLITLSVRAVPIDTNYPAINTVFSAKNVAKRTTRR